MDGQQLVRNIPFTLTTADGSALVGQDYSFLSVVHTFNPVNDRALLCASVDTVNDTLVEGDEAFFVDMNTSFRLVNTDPSRLTVTIVDGDQASDSMTIYTCTSSFIVSMILHVTFVMVCYIIIIE